jgi:hypothetical protein
MASMNRPGSYQDVNEAALYGGKAMVSVGSRRLLLVKVQAEAN